MAVIGYYTGPTAVLAMSGARPIAKEDDPQLYNIVEELASPRAFRCRSST